MAIAINAMRDRTAGKARPEAQDYVRRLTEPQIDAVVGFLLDQQGPAPTPDAIGEGVEEGAATRPTPLSKASPLPTAVLTPQEVDELFITLQQMKADGHALIFISHKLHEVLHLSERVTVLRDGRNVGTVPTAQANHYTLAEMMVGRPLMAQPAKKPVAPGKVQLELKDIWAADDRTQPALRGISLIVHGGEVLGIAGVSGNGQRELAEVIAGLRPSSQGHIYLTGQDMTGKSPRLIMNSGLAYVPEERMKEGVIKDFSVSENLILREHDRQPYARSAFLRFRAIEQAASGLVQAFSVKTPSLDTPVKNLSGGNIQKLVLARELSRRPQVLVAAQPTRGLDIGATEYVHGRLLQQREQGTATLLISEDLDEILALSDRIAVIYEGQIMGEMQRAEATPETLGLLMAGVQTVGSGQ